MTRAKAYKGSYSFFATKGGQTAAKIVIFQHGLGKMNGDWPNLSDGVYVLLRTGASVTDAIWGQVTDIDPKFDRSRTIGIAPKHGERFAYFKVSKSEYPERIAEVVNAFLKGTEK